jgi:putative transposase
MLVTPVPAPNANAYAERWIRTVPAQCLDWLLSRVTGTWSRSSESTSGPTTGTGRTRALQLQAPDPATGLTIVDEGREGSMHRPDLLDQYRRAA